MTTAKHPDPNHTDTTDPDANKANGEMVVTTTTTTTTTSSAEPKAKPATATAETKANTNTNTETEEAKKKGFPWAPVLGAMALLLLLGGAYWFGTHNSGSATPVPVASTCCPQQVATAVPSSPCCPQPLPLPAPTPPPPPSKSAQQCANEAVAGMQVANADDSDAAAAAALEACKEAGLK